MKRNRLETLAIWIAVVQAVTLVLVGLVWWMIVDISRVLVAFGWDAVGRP